MDTPNAEIWREPPPPSEDPPEPSITEEEKSSSQVLASPPPDTLEDDIQEPTTPQTAERVSSFEEEPSSVSPFSFEEDYFTELGNASHLPQVH